MKREDFEKAYNLIGSIKYHEHRIRSLKSDHHFDCVLHGTYQKESSPEAVERARLIFLQDAEENLEDLLATLEGI